MPDAADPHASRRAELLAAVADLCARAGAPVETGAFTPRSGPPVWALRCAAEDSSWDAVITVVRARSVAAGSTGPVRRYSRHPVAGYDLATDGELVYEVQIHEDDDGAGGHGSRPLVVFELVATAQAAADVLILWVSRASLFRCQPPVLDPDVLRRWERHRYEHRQAAAAAARVDVAASARQHGCDASVVDPAALCWHFPRERTGRYRRHLQVALAPCGSAGPHRRAPWLAARASGNRLVLEVTGLIPANQAHRWDLTPWLWDRRHAETPPATRWQVQRPEDAAPAFGALRRGQVAEALGMAGVRTDAQITALLAGRPTRLSRSGLTAGWVAHLYAGLADVAPWRLAAAHQEWRERLAAQGGAVREPVTLFGLGGMSQARKPKVALDAAADGPLLRLHFTGGNAVLPRSLWTLPADLVAHLYGWRGTSPARTG